VTEVMQEAADVELAISRVRRSGLRELMVQR